MKFYLTWIKYGKYIQKKTIKPLYLNLLILKPVSSIAKQTILHAEESIAPPKGLAQKNMLDALILVKICNAIKKVLMATENQ